MPRQARKKSKTNIYHIMLRGINHQIIFEEREDYERFIKTLARYKTISGYTVYAYCLMSNHIHLLIKEGKENLEQIMKRVAGSYVSEIRKLDIAERNKCIKVLKDGGLSIRQISRITGVSKYAVEKS